MRMPTSVSRRQALVTAAAGLAAWRAAPALAQAGNWPAKTVTVVVPYAAGGGTDIIARTVAQRLQERWGQSVVVDNKAGANGTIGSAFVAEAPPDGYTLLMVVGSHAINPVLMKSLPYETRTAFTPVMLLAQSPTVFVVSSTSPYKNLKDLLAAAQREEIAYGYSEGHTRLTGELARQIAKIKFLGVAYKGGAPIMVDVIGGHLPVGVTSVLTALPHVKAGKLRVIAVAARERMPIFPEAMTFEELGYKGVESSSWYGMFGPAGLSPTVVARLNTDLKAVATDPDLKRQMEGQGATLVLTPPDAFQKFLDQETAKWGRVAKAGGIEAE